MEMWSAMLNDLPTINGNICDKGIFVPQEFLLVNHPNDFVGHEAPLFSV